jgi:hypothetical protein
VQSNSSTRIRVACPVNRQLVVTAIEESKKANESKGGLNLRDALLSETMPKQDPPFEDLRSELRARLPRFRNHTFSMSRFVIFVRTLR